MKKIAAAALMVALAAPGQAHAAPPKSHCPQWYKLAREVGFTRADWPRLDAIIWRESHCAPGAKGYNKRADGSVWSTDFGLSQINNYSWVSYLRNLRIIKTSDDLLHPRTNLRAAKALYDYSKSRGLDPWFQWRGNGSGVKP